MNPPDAANTNMALSCVTDATVYSGPLSAMICAMRAVIGLKSMT
jgi:hypothetical protein